MSASAIPAALAEAGAAIQVTPAPAATGACASCGAGLQGEFCHACGERRPRPDELTLRAFAGDVAAEVGNLDGRIPRSIALLLTRPGFLTAEYLAGRRRGYVGPFKLFIVAYGTVLLATALLVRPDAEAAAQPPGTSWRTRLLHTIAARNGWSPELALEQLSTTFFNHMGWLQLLIPLLFGASVALVFARRHRGFVAHLVFAAHVAAFECAVSLAVLPTGVAAERLPATVVSLAGVFSIGVLGWYLCRAVERVYGEEGWRGAIRAAALLVGFNLAQGVTGLIALCTAVVALLYL